MTHAHALVVGLAQLVSRPSAPFHASTAVVSPLPLNAYVMQAGEEPTAIKACKKKIFWWLSVLYSELTHTTT